MSGSTSMASELSTSPLGICSPFDSRRSELKFVSNSLLSSFIRLSLVETCKGCRQADEKLQSPYSRLNFVCKKPEFNEESTSGDSRPESDKPRIKPFQFSIVAASLCLAFGGFSLVMKKLISSLPPNFLERWQKMLSEKPDPDLKEFPTSPFPTTLYDCHGEVIAVIGSQGLSSNEQGPKRGPLRPDEVPPYMWQAILASEDRNFFSHRGFDPKGLARAVLSMARSGGGSTVTQQVVKNMFLSHERSWSRKLMEIVLAICLEQRMSKWQILLLYVNKIYWGHGVYGLESAASLYFAKHASQLSLGECAMLAGIIPAPELLSPFRDPSGGRKAQARSLRRMVESGFLDERTAKKSLEEPLRLATESQERNTGLQVAVSGPWRAPYFVSEVLYELSNVYGRQAVLEGGLQVYTSLDLGLQEKAEKALLDGTRDYDRERIAAAIRGRDFCVDKIAAIRKEHREKVLDTLKKQAVRRCTEGVSFKGGEGAGNYQEVAETMLREDKLLVEKESDKLAKRLTFWDAQQLKYEREISAAKTARLEGALVAMDPLSGDIRSLVGGRDYYYSNFNRATQALRPPGSTFKPVVYLAALQSGLDKNHTLMDEPYAVGDFKPENYDKKFRGKVTLEGSLVRSLNVPTVKLCSEVGLHKVIATARALGLLTPLPYELALSLGGCEVTPVQLTTVYASLASGGVYRPPRLIIKVLDSEGNDMNFPDPSSDPENFSSEEETAELIPRCVAELRRLMQAVVDHGTGRGAKIDRPCAGKTGTSDGHRDVWFAGFTPQLACSVWLGYDDNAPVGGVFPGTGASHAAPVWKSFMMAAHKGFPVLKFHDIGSDRHGGKAPSREFQKRSRRVQRSTRQKFSGDRLSPWQIHSQMYGPDSTVEWMGVFDWQRASSVAEEREKMSAWIQERREGSAHRQALKAWWGEWAQKGRRSMEGKGSSAEAHLS